MPFDAASGQFTTTLETPEDTRFLDRPEPDGFKLLDLDDSLLFIPRGIEGLARSVGQLPIDLLNLGGAGIDVDLTADRFTGRSDSLIGGLLEGITQIALPFGATHKLLGAFRSAKFLGRALTQSRQIQVARSAAQQGMRAAGARLGQGVAAGAVADFVAFGGHEMRLSNFIQTVPALRNDVTEFLAAKPGQEQAILGRMKSVLEGMGIGFAFDVIPAILKGTKAFRKAQAAGKSPEDTVKAAEAAWEKAGAPEKAAEVLTRVEQEIAQSERVARDGAREDLIDVDTFDDDAARRVLPKAQRDVGIPDDAGVKEIELEAAEKLRREAAGEDIEAKVAAKAGKPKPGKAKKKGALGIAEIVARGMDPSPLILQKISAQFEGNVGAALRVGLAKFEELFANNIGLIRTRLGGDPKRLSDEVKAAYGLSQAGLLDLKNVSTTSAFADADEEVITLIRAFESFLSEKGIPLRLPKQTIEEITYSSVPIASDLLDMGPDEFVRFISPIVTSAERVSQFTTSLQMIIGGFASRITRLALAARDPASISPEIAKILGIEDHLKAGTAAIEGLAVREMDKYGLWVQSLSRLRSASGRSLKTAQIPFTTRVLDLVGADVDAIRGGRARELLGEDEFLKRMEAIASLAEMDPHARGAALTKFLKKSPIDKFMAWTTEWVISALLWSPKTSVTNALFPFMTSVWVPMENMVGGLLGSASGLARGNHRFQQEFRTLGNTMAGMMYAAKWTRRTMKEGHPFDPRLSRFQETEFGQAGFRVTSQETFDAMFPSGKFGIDTFGGFVINALGKFMDVPTRVMQTTDNYNKLFVAYSNGMGIFQEEAARLGIADPASYVAEKMSKLFDDGRLLSHKLLTERADKTIAGEAISQLPKADPARQARKKELMDQFRKESNFAEMNPIAEELLRRGRDTTATLELRPGTLSNSVNAMADKHPVMRMIIPFIRTPANLAAFAGQRSPMDLMTTTMLVAWQKVVLGKDVLGTELKALSGSRFRNVRDLSSPDPNVRADAVGRLGTGVGIFIGIAMAADAGIITGHGPADEGRRRALTDAGWLPYSIKTPKGYVQYLRADPFAMTLGLATDIYETTKLSHELGDEKFLLAATMGLVDGISSNITSRTYMAGVRSFLDAVSQPERAGGQFIANFTPLPVPPIAIPRVFGQLKQHFSDPVLRDAHTVLERVRQKTAWLGNVPPLRNVMGEPIERVTSLRPGGDDTFAGVPAGSSNDTPGTLWFDMFIPIAYREVSDDVIKREFVALQHGFSPPRRQKFGVDLGDFTNGAGRNAYDRWGELHGKVRLNGRTIRQELKKLIQSSPYKRLPLESLDFENSPRVRLLKGVIARYRGKAFETMMTEFPEVRREVRRNRKDRAAVLAGRRPSRELQEIPFPFKEFQ